MWTGHKSRTGLIAMDVPIYDVDISHEITEKSFERHIPTNYDVEDRRPGESH